MPHNHNRIYNKTKWNLKKKQKRFLNVWKIFEFILVTNHTNTITQMRARFGEKANQNNRKMCMCVVEWNRILIMSFIHTYYTLIAHAHTQCTLSRTSSIEFAIGTNSLLWTQVFSLFGIMCCVFSPNFACFQYGSYHFQSFWLWSSFFCHCFIFVVKMKTKPCHSLKSKKKMIRFTLYKCLWCNLIFQIVNKWVCIRCCRNPYSVFVSSSSLHSLYLQLTYFMWSKRTNDWTNKQTNKQRNQLEKKRNQIVNYLGSIEPVTALYLLSMSLIITRDFQSYNTRIKLDRLWMAEHVIGQCLHTRALTLVINSPSIWLTESPTSPYEKKNTFQMLLIQSSSNRVLMSEGFEIWWHTNCHPENRQTNTIPSILKFKRFSDIQ